MKQTYEKPFSTVVQLATENIIAASEVFNAAAITTPADIAPENIIGDSIGEAW